MNTTEQLYARFRETTGIVTDTRRITPDCFFVALRGANHDGNRFAAAAIAAGAKYALVDDPAVLPPNPADAAAYLLVSDTLAALQALATHHRRSFNCPVLAITGSNGKTTTKELVLRVLASRYRTHATEGNHNNHIGVPLTLLAMPDDTEIAIIEMGMNHLGEIATLCHIAEPTHGLVTNIGKAHMEGVGGIEGVKQAKAELYRHLQQTEGTAFVNTNQAFLADLASGVRHIVEYGDENEGSAKGSDNTSYAGKFVEANPFVRMRFGGVEIDTHLFGGYNYQNLLTAAVVGAYFGVVTPDIQTALASYRPDNNRVEVVHRGSDTYLLDAYNANPTSMEAALRAFAELKPRRRVAILGSMLELGEYAPDEHAHIARLARVCADVVYLVGSEFAAFAPLADGWYPNVDAFKMFFDTLHKPTDTAYLIKGSRGNRLEQIMQASEAKKSGA